ncbi:hypothetical protein Leryth_012308 [Lithospermum erythrorhizon]|nr:hypothetical protein Leryth_012308 [Lithospermum erythrorhizon]
MKKMMISLRWNAMGLVLCLLRLSWILLHNTFLRFQISQIGLGGSYYTGLKVTNLRSGGMILSLAINHCLCDGIGTSQFLHAWAHFTNKPTSTLLPLTPYHSRHVFNPRHSLNFQFTPPGFTIPSNNNNNNNSHPLNILKYLQSQPLKPSSLVFTPSLILQLKKQCSPSLKCTTFEVLASHTWRSWVHSLDLPSSLNVKLLFSVNVRKRMKPELPQGYYGNAFVLACAESRAKELVNSNLHNLVKLVQQAKETPNDDYVNSIIDLMEDKNVATDLSTSLVISQWSKLGLEDLDFGQGKPSHMSSLTSDVYCLFLPVLGEFNAVRVLVSMPESIIRKFEYHMMEFSIKEHNG